MDIIGETKTANKIQMKRGSKKKSQEALTLAEKFRRDEGATIIQDMEDIVNFAEDTHLDAELFAEDCPVASQITSIADKFGIGRKEAVLFSVLVNECGSYQCNDGDLSRFFSCSRLRIMEFSDAITSLSRKDLLWVDRDGDYRVPYFVQSALKKNEAYRFKGYKATCKEELLSSIAVNFARLGRNYISGDDAADILECILSQNKDMDIVRDVKSLGIDDKYLECWFWLLLSGISEGDTSISPEDIDRLLPNRFTKRRFISGFQTSSNTLFEKGMIENGGDQFMGNSYCLTRKAISIFFPEMESMVLSKGVSRKDVIQAGSILEKELFYNGDEGELVGTLADRLSAENFALIKERLSEKGMRKGFTCLFYGGPGTGKTETAMQLARRSGRDVILVDMSQLRDKYVGESEKRVKALFDNYRCIMKESALEPILLLNEADAIVGKRTDTRNSVDKMENAMQNIILQEMENFEGILIATTNLTNNFDSAFSRRFLFKIQFKRPSPEIRSRIWKSMVGELSDSEALSLAEEFDFSGGQIENVSRKNTINYILGGEGAVCYDSIRKLCLDENIHAEESTARKIGF